MSIADSFSSRLRSHRSRRFRSLVTAVPVTVSRLKFIRALRRRMRSHVARQRLPEVRRRPTIAKSRLPDLADPTYLSAVSGPFRFVGRVCRERRRTADGGEEQSGAENEDLRGRRRRRRRRRRNRMENGYRKRSVGSDAPTHDDAGAIRAAEAHDILFN